MHFALKCISKKLLSKQKHISFIKVTHIIDLGVKVDVKHDKFEGFSFLCKILSVVQGQFLHLLPDGVH